MFNKKRYNKLLIKTGQGLFLFYKSFISPVFLSGLLFLRTNCKFYPSCSVYACEALEKHGIFYGTFMSLKRVLKCNPFYGGNI